MDEEKQMELLSQKLVLNKQNQALKAQISSLEEITETIYRQKQEAEAKVKQMAQHEEQVGIEMDKLAQKHHQFKE